MNRSLINFGASSVFLFGLASDRPDAGLAAQASPKTDMPVEPAGGREDLILMEAATRGGPQSLAIPRAKVAPEAPEGQAEGVRDSFVRPENKVRDDLARMGQEARDYYAPQKKALEEKGYPGLANFLYGDPKDIPWWQWGILWGAVSGGCFLTLLSMQKHLNKIPLLMVSRLEKLSRARQNYIIQRDLKIQIDFMKKQKPLSEYPADSIRRMQSAFIENKRPFERLLESSCRHEKDGLWKESIILLCGAAGGGNASAIHKLLSILTAVQNGEERYADYAFIKDHATPEELKRMIAFLEDLSRFSMAFK